MDAAPRRLVLRPYEEVFSFVSKALNIMCLPHHEAARVRLDIDPRDEEAWGSDGKAVKDALAEAVLRCFEHVYEAGVEYETDSEGSEDSVGSSTLCHSDESGFTEVDDVPAVYKTKGRPYSWHAFLNAELADDESHAAEVGYRTPAENKTPARPLSWPMFRMILPTVPLIYATNPTPGSGDISLPFDEIDLDRLVVPGFEWVYEDDEDDDEGGEYEEVEVEVDDIEAADNDNDDNDGADNNNGDNAIGDNASSDDDAQCHPDCRDDFHCLYETSEIWHGEEDFMPLVGRVIELDDLVTFDVSADVIRDSVSLDKFKLGDDDPDLDRDAVNIDLGDLKVITDLGDTERTLDSIDDLLPVFDINALPDLSAILAAELNTSPLPADAPNMRDFLAHAPDISGFLASTPDTSDEVASADADGESDSFEYDDAGVWGV